MQKKFPKFIFVIGGVMSGVGKGITTASIGKILQAKGYKVTALKIDPYINVDAGTMNPTEHGEVFVTEDGDETDQDIGNYERFMGQNIYRINYMTTGRVYRSVIEAERNLKYGGRCVQVVPHIPEEVIRRIEGATLKAKAEFAIIEIGGTVGEYENILFLEAVRIMKLRYPENVGIVLVSYLPIPNKIGEMKTKPTQHASRALNSVGLQADFIIARAEEPLDLPRKRKISIFCNIVEDDVISAPDIDSVYDVPINFEKDQLGEKILKKFGLKPKTKDLKDWVDLSNRIKKSKKEIKIGIVGKYFTIGEFVLSDAYISVIEAVKHACWLNNVKPNIKWLDSEVYEHSIDKLKELDDYDGIIVPGGFGSRGVEGKILAAKYCRENRIPYFGLCYGMQMAVVEFARNVAGLKNANTTEIDPETKFPVIHVMPEQAELLAKKNYGNSMRLGAWPCLLKPNTLSFEAYGTKKISERHRHRYEFNNKYKEILEKNGLVFAGTSPDGKLVEIVELPKDQHPFYVGVQFHPEFKSRPISGHPLFNKFIEAAINKK